MIVLGIDPGLASTGVGVVREDEQRALRLVASGHLITTTATPLPERLLMIRRLVSEAIRDHRPDVVSMESLFFAKNVRSAVMMAHGRGAAIVAVAEHGIPLFEYSPLEIKQSVVGKGRAAKEQVSQMVAVLLGLAESPRSDHETDALAAAICHAHRHRAFERLGGAAGRAAPAGESEAVNAYEMRKALLARRRRK